MLQTLVFGQILPGCFRMSSEQAFCCVCFLGGLRTTQFRKCESSTPEAAYYRSTPLPQASPPYQGGRSYALATHACIQANIKTKAATIVTLAYPGLPPEQGGLACATQANVCKAVRTTRNACVPQGAALLSLRWRTSVLPGSFRMPSGQAFFLFAHDQCFEYAQLRL